jgi:hypothetical protein
MTTQYLVADGPAGRRTAAGRAVPTTAGLPPATGLAEVAVAGPGSGLVRAPADAAHLERIPGRPRGRVVTVSRAAAWIGVLVAPLVEPEISFAPWPAIRWNTPRRRGPVKVSAGAS